MSFLRFVQQQGASIKCDKRTDSTLLNMIGGKYRITDHVNTQFLRAYTADCKVKHFCFSEVVSTVAPFFIDIDYFDTELSVQAADEDIFKAQVGAWCTAVTRAISLVTPEEPAHTEISGGMTVESIQLLRDTMSSKIAVLATAPARTVTKHDVTGTKVGLHLLWPNLLVTKTTAQRLQAVVTSALYKISPEKNWETIIDLAVYRPMSSLRMLNSYKFTKCASCSSDQYKEQSKLRAQAALGCKLKKTCTFAELKAAYENLLATNQEVSVAVKTYFAAKPQCTKCKGRARVVDVSAGFYTVGAVLNGDGSLNAALTDLAEADDFVAIFLSSVRRAAGTAETPLLIPVNAPVALQVIVVPAADDEELGSEEVTVRDLSFTADKFVRADIIGKEADIIGLAEDWLHSTRTDWDQLQISSIYRLIIRSKLAANKMQNGDSDYLVVITVRGFGANYCSMANRCHTSNHVYFVLNSSGVAVQKCHSTALPVCTKAGMPFKINRAVFCELYPFEKSVMAVTAEDIGRDFSIALSEELLSTVTASMFKRKSMTLPDAASAAKVIEIQRKAKLQKASGGPSELEAFYKRRKIGKYSAAVDEEEIMQEDVGFFDDEFL